MLFLEVLFLAFLALNIEEEVWPNKAYPMLFAESSCVDMQNFRPVASFFLGKSNTFSFFNTDRGVAMLKRIPW